MTYLLGAILMVWTSEFVSWLNQPIRDTVVVWRLVALDWATGDPVTLWAASEPRRTPATDTPPSTTIPGVVVPDLSIRRGIRHPWSSTVQTGGASGTQIELMNPSGELDGWADYDWRDQVQELYIGPRAWPVSELGLWYRGISDYCELTDDLLIIVLSDPLLVHDVPLQPARFSGERNAGVDGRPRPIVLGRAHFVEPALVDHVDLIYRYADSVDTELDAVFSDGYELEPIAGETSGWDSARVRGDVALSNGGRTATKAPHQPGGPLWGEVHGEAEIDLLGDSDPTYFEVAVESIGQGGIDGNLWVGIGDAGTMAGGANPDPLTMTAAFVVGFRGDGMTLELVWWDAAGGGDATGPPEVSWPARRSLPVVEAAGQVVGVLVTPSLRQVEFFVDGVSFGAIDIPEDMTVGDFGQPLVGHLWYPYAAMLGVDGETVVTLRTDIEDMEYAPAGLLSRYVKGRAGDYVEGGVEFALARNPNDAKITVHAASVTPATWQGWSIPAGWTADGLELTASVGPRSGYLPAPRATDRFVVEFEVLERLSLAALELCLVWPCDPDEETAGQGRGRRGVSWYSDGAVYALGGDGAQAATTGGWGAGDRLAICVDKVADAVELYTVGASTTLEAVIPGDQIAARWGAARGPMISWEAYYRLPTAPDSLGTSQRGMGTVLLKPVADPAGDEVIFTQGNGYGVRILLDSARRVVVEASDGTFQASLGRARTSPLALDRWHAIVWAIDTVTQSLVIYVDGAADTELTTEVVRDGLIDYSEGQRAIGAGHDGGAALESACLRYLSYAPGQWADLSDASVRHAIYSWDHQPAADAWEDVYPVQPAIWCHDGHGPSNTGTSGPITEQGVVPVASSSTFRSAVCCPGVYAESGGVRVTAVLSDLAGDYPARTRPWGEAMSAAEALRALAGGEDDYAANFAATVRMPALIGYCNAAEGDTRYGVMQAIARSVGGGLVRTRDGRIRLIVLADLESDAVDHVIDYARHRPAGAVIQRIRDRGEDVTTSIGGWRVWAPHSSGEVAAAVDLPLANLVQKRWGIVSDVGGRLARAYAHGEQGRLRETLISDGDPLDRSAPRSTARLSSRVSQLYARPRSFFRVPFLHLPLLEVGDTVELVGARLAGNRKLVVLEVDSDVDSHGEAVLWGLDVLPAEDVGGGGDPGGGDPGGGDPGGDPLLQPTIWDTTHDPTLAQWGGDMVFMQSQDDAVLSTTSRSAGRFYVDVMVWRNTTNFDGQRIGFTDGSRTPHAHPEADSIGEDYVGLAIDVRTGQVWRDGSVIDTLTGFDSRFSESRLVRWCLDLDAGEILVAIDDSAWNGPYAYSLRPLYLCAEGRIGAHAGWGENGTYAAIPAGYWSWDGSQDETGTRRIPHMSYSNPSAGDYLELGRRYEIPDSSNRWLPWWLEPPRTTGRYYLEVEARNRYGAALGIGVADQATRDAFTSSDFLGDGALTGATAWYGGYGRVFSLGSEVLTPDVPGVPGNFTNWRGAVIFDLNAREMWVGNINGATDWYGPFALPASGPLWLTGACSVHAHLYTEPEEWVLPVPSDVSAWGRA